MASRISGILDQARTKTQVLVDEMAPTKKRSQNERVGQTCERLLLQRPPRRPTYALVAEEGQIHFPNFPSKSRLENGYKEIHQIWSEAYDALIDMSVTDFGSVAQEPDISNADLTNLDAGTRQNVMILKALYQEVNLRNIRLTQLIRDNVPLVEIGETTSVFNVTCHCEFPPKLIRVRPDEGRTNEEAEIYGRADHHGFARAGGWGKDSRSVPQAWHFRSNVL